MTSARLARIAFAAVACVAALVASGCSTKHAVVTEGETEGIWVNAGPLDYHIQGSRVLVPGVQPDAAYLKGVPDGVADPAGDEVWFAVFLRIENKSEDTASTAKEFEILDTEGRSFAPFGLDPERNPFAYQPMELLPSRAVPVPDSPQDINSFSGAELLFKLPLESYQNRPLELVIHSAGGEGPEEASVSLDV